MKPSIGAVAILLTGACLYAKPLFTPDSLPSYLTLNNPYVFRSVGEALEARAMEIFAQGAFDTLVTLDYDDKRYPLSTGSYQAAQISQPFANGIELSAGYRNAKGIQEYNNIKTGPDGEMIVGIKVPVFSAWHGISKRQTEALKAKLRTQEHRYRARIALLDLYRSVLQAYYQTLFYRDMLLSEQALLQKAIRNDRFVQKAVKLGHRPRIARVESRNLIFQRKQRLLQARNNFKQAKQVLLQYLGIDEKKFDRRYRLPSLPRQKVPIPSLTESLAEARRNRPEFGMLEQMLALNRADATLNRLEAFPKLDLSLYGTYDFRYDEGYKVSVDFSLPLQRRRYRGKQEALRYRKLVVASQKETLLREIKTQLINTIQEIRLRNEAVEIARQSIQAAKAVEQAEERKYREGISQLPLLNQRQIATLEATQALLHHYYRLRMLEIRLDAITARLYRGAIRNVLR